MTPRILLESEHILSACALNSLSIASKNFFTGIKGCDGWFELLIVCVCAIAIFAVF